MRLYFGDEKAPRTYSETLIGTNHIMQYDPSRKVWMLWELDVFGNKVIQPDGNPMLFTNKSDLISFVFGLS